MTRPCVVVPVFDNAATVGDVVRGAAEHADLVVVVDDGSADGSGDPARAVASSLPPGRVDVLRLPRNRGKGAALLAGFARAAELGRTHAVTIDADGQHRASEIPLFLGAAAAHPAAIVVGARDMDAAHVPHAARVGRRVSNFWTHRTTGTDLPDTTCGFRVYPVREVLALGVRTRRYDFEGEVLVRAAWAGLELRSLPIDVWYPRDPAERVSHYRAWVDSLRITAMYVRLALLHLVPGRAARRAAGATARPRVRLRDTFRTLRALTSSGTRANELALALGVGVFLGATPLWGLHAALALWIAARWRLNLAAAFLGTQVSFPAFAPALVFAQVQAGHRLRTGEWLDLRGVELDAATAGAHLADYVLGAFAVAAVLGIVTGLVTLRVAGDVERWRARRARGDAPTAAPAAPATRAAP